MQQFNCKSLCARHFNLFDYGSSPCVRVNNGKTGETVARNDLKLQKVSIITLNKLNGGES